MTNQTDIYDQKEDKMTRIIMTFWDEDCKKKMTDETGGGFVVESMTMALLKILQDMTV